MVLLGGSLEGGKIPKSSTERQLSLLVAPWVNILSPAAGSTAGSQDVTGLEAKQNLPLGAGTTGGSGLEHLLNSS